MGQAVATSRFYFYGKQHFTRTGWLNNSALYPANSQLESYDMKGRVSVVTGANSGIGRQVAEYLAARGSTVYMVCRNSEKAEIERNAIVTKTKNSNVNVMVGDCGLASDNRRIAEEICKREKQVHCLVCNAGALGQERVLTAEGNEVTFATHLLCGTYIFTEALRPALSAAAGARVIAVSSGGMYNTKYIHDLATGARGGFNGQMAYAYAKRGQVLLCERWAEAVGEETAFVSCHPGWSATPGVEAAYGTSQKWLQPMRSDWEGAEGICWLCVAPRGELQSGAFYLDRMPQPKHLPGWLCRNFTVNTPEEVNSMMTSLADLAAR